MISAKGGRGGGGAQLTPFGQELIRRYRQFEVELQRRGAKVFAPIAAHLLLARLLQLAGLASRALVAYRELLDAHPQAAGRGARRACGELAHIPMRSFRCSEAPLSLLRACLKR